MKNIYIFLSLIILTLSWEIIFYSKGYSEPWNGIYKGSPVPEGTYAYIVRVDADKVYRGVVLVVR